MVAIALSLLAAIGLGGGAVSARGGMPGVHPLTTIGVSLVVGFTGVVIVALAFAFSDLVEVPRAVLPWIVALGVVQFAGGRSLGYLGVSSIGASRTALFISAQAPFAAFFAIAFTGEALRPLVAVGTVGVVAALLLDSGDSLTQGWRTDRPYLIGCLTALAAGATMGGSTVLAKQTISVYGSPLAVTVLGMLVGMMVIVPVVGIAAVRYPAVRTFDGKSMSFVFRGDCRAHSRHLPALDAAAVPRIYRPAGGDNPAADHRRDPGCGGRDSGGRGRAAMRASGAGAPALPRKRRTFPSTEVAPQ